ncbi:MAG TPA: alpha-L-glutamate ligase [Alphaproteobacteria bacterium]|nr:alpha-L-glutamate ligase [Alphaproteobacteria bacterium]
MPRARANEPAKIYILHENDAWTAPLLAALRELGAPHETWHLDRGFFDLAAPPPAGVFYNRVSPSSHTRGHRYAPEYTACVLAWLEAHGRRVVNGSAAFALELSKTAQYAALTRHGLAVPHSLPAVGREEILAAARRLGAPFITKHNRAGKGLGVHLFRSLEALAAYLDGPAFEESVDGVTLVQRYIEAPEPFITRVEFIGGRFFYAVRVDTSEGFELCPADACQVGDTLCPTGDGAHGDSSPAKPPKFQILARFESPLVARYGRFMAAHGIEIAGFELITDKAGNAYTYDVNMNTNYNAEAEAAAGRFGMKALAAHLAETLARSRAGAEASAAA